MTTDGNVADADLVVDMAVINHNESSTSRPIISIYSGNNYVGRLVVLEKGQEVSPTSSSSSGLEEDSDSSNKSLEKSRMPQDNDLESKRFNMTLSSTNESSQNTSSESMEDACGMGQCNVKSQAYSEEEVEDISKELNNGTAPFVNILPEYRRFIVVISSADCNNKNFCRLLKDFSLSFENYRKVSTLEFNMKTPVLEHNGRLYIAAADEHTMEWVMNVICGLDGYLAVPLHVFLHLSQARVVFPKVESCLKLIFDQLEKQNPGLNTDKWAVINREDLDPCSKENITKICVNEVFELYIDVDSVEFIKSLCYQLRYCFFHVEFMFCQ
ncbi:uncharacterized protein [Drosophila tropicalis]|uniref:uncharacterized protein n=1 Tax=Drosophila tropicalis TaxID=46794 RepID=UPI0035AB7186